MAAQMLISVLLVLLYSMRSVVATKELYVKSATSTCMTTPCHTLDDYVSNSSEYFTSDTRFLFLEGEHYLNTPLVLDSIVSISMSGVGTGVRITISEGAGISFSNSATIVLSTLEIVYMGNEAGYTLKSALLFINSHSVQILGVHFTGLNSGTQYSRALNYTLSSSQVTNCSFSNGRSPYGGAISVNSSTINFSGTNSYTNSTAEVSGGAVYAQNSTLTFVGTNTFLKNRASTLYPTGLNYNTGGGGLFALQTVVQLNGFTTFMDNGPIDENQFIFGGAVMLRQSSNLSLLGSAVFNNNSADSGGAVFCVNSSFSLSGEINFTNNRALRAMGGALFAHSSNMQCQGNVIFQDNRATTGGAVYSEISTLNYQDNITFSGNFARFRGGASYAIDTTLEVSGIINYVENAAPYGGGMGFEGSSTQLILKPSLVLNFNRNRAEFGGALYFLDSNSMYIAQCQNSTVERVTCFFRTEIDSLPSTDVRLNFVENKVDIAGSVLYGGALQLCQVELSDGDHVPGLQFLQNISNIVLSDDNTSYISSDPLRVCFCTDRGEPDCYGPRYDTRNIFPGQTFNVSVITVGQFDMPVSSTVRALIYENSNSETELNPPNYINDGRCSDISFQLKTKDNYIQLAFVSDGPCVSVESTISYIYLTLDPCPPGFNQSINHCICENQLLELNIDNVCDIDTELIERPGKAWLKPIFSDNQTYRGFMWHPNCPVGYCRPEGDNVMLDFTANDTDVQCTTNRTGVVCGGCKEGYSLILNKFECKECENRYISLILVFGLAGIALIAVLLALHWTVAAGTINGLILYVNFVNIYRDTFFPPERTGVNPLTLFIAWLNLDFGIPSCFFDGLDAYSYAWLQFVFPLYLWFLIGLIICISKVSAKVVKLFGSNPIAVLATVILMSYTKLLQTTVEVLSYTHLEFPDNTREKRWTSDPNIHFLEGKHAVLAIFSLFVIVFLLFPYIILLMFGYRLQAHSGKRGFRWFNKLKPLLDAYYAPYRKRTRYWTGFLLLIRGFLFLTFIPTTINANLVAGASLFTAIAIIPWLSERVYEKFYVDALEASFFLNICILTSVTYHAQAVQDTRLQVIVTDFSVAVALIEFVGIVIFHIYLRLKKANFLPTRKFVKAILRPDAKKSAKKVVEEETSSITSTVVGIREPLLEDD